MKKFKSWSLKIFDSEWLCEQRGNPDRQPSNRKMFLLNNTLFSCIIMSTLSQNDTYLHWKPYKVQSCLCAANLRGEDNIKCFDSRRSSSQHRSPLPVTTGPRLISHALRPDRRNMSDMQVVSWCVPEPWRQTVSHQVVWCRWRWYLCILPRRETMKRTGGLSWGRRHTSTSTSPRPILFLLQPETTVGPVTWGLCSNTEWTLWNPPSPYPAPPDELKNKKLFLNYV